MSVSKQQVAALYAAVFNRAPDQSGLEYWVANAESFENMALGFVAHPVFEKTYGELSNEDFVKAIYENVLQGAGDDEGVSFWVGALDGGLGRTEFLASFLDAALNYDGDDVDGLARKAALDNQVEVGLYFTETMGEKSNLDPNTDVDSLDIEDDAAYQAAQATIADVTADRASVEAAKAAIDEAADEGTESLTEALAIIAEGGELPEIYSLSDADANFADQTVAGLADSIALANEVIAGATNAAELELNATYTLADTLENLTAAEAAVLEGAASYSLTDEAGDFGSLTEEQIALVQGATNAADFTYGTIGETFTLTAGIDNLTGTAGDDTFNAPMTDGGTPTQTLTGLDSIDGGAGTDTLNVDFGSAAAALPSTATITNIEVLNAATSSTAAVSNLDVSGNADIKTVMLANGGNQNSTVKGGEDVTVSGGAVTNVSGTALKSVTVNKAAGDGAAAVDAVISNDTAAATGVGTTLTSVTLNGLASSAATATIAGNAVDTVSVNNQKSALATTITNTVSKALAVNVDGSGYTAAGATVVVSVTAGAAAENITVNATGAKSNVTVNAAAAKNLTLTGSADLKLAGVSGAALTAINGSAATGGLDLGALNAGTAKVTTGAGNDKFELKATKVTVDAGAGNDTVTLGSTIAVGSTINLGAGNDALLSNGGAVTANTTSASTVIDAGEGTDTVAASLINATNAAQFVNFERIDASVGTNTLDLNLMTGSTIEGATLNGGAGTVSLQNLAAGSDLTVAGANTGTTTIGLKGAAAGTEDAFTVNFAGADVAATASAANVTAGTIVANGVEALTINSNGGTNTWNSVTITDDKLKTLTITGEQNLDLAFAGTNGTNVAAGGGAVNLIDGSAATGKLAINLANVTADNSATGLTVKGGSAADLITTNASSSTLTGNGGDDSFVVTSTVAGGTTAATVAKTTITDFAAGDKITGLAGAGDIAKINLTSAVQSLDNAFGLLGDNTGTNDVQWFNYGQSTYVVYNDVTAGLSAGDVVVELIGIYDLSNATVSAGVLELA